MSNTKVPERDSLPKTGRVNEVCQEWMVREDSALAYRLQNQEFVDHLSGNKVRNAMVREDYPKAKDEQIREQLLAEQAAAIYQKMLAEQEEMDKKVAKDLAEKLEREERMKRRVLEVRDQDVVRQMLEKERNKVERLHHMPTQFYTSPQKQALLPPRNEVQTSPHRPNPYNYQVNMPRRQAAAMPLPNEHSDVYIEPIRHEEVDSAELYNEPYKTSRQLTEQFNKIEIAEVGLPLDELTEKQIQEQKDAELARQLQEQEGNLEDSLLNRDRMLAIEAQDKELAKLLQERERAKAKRAREKAKQKALAKKQQAEQERSINQILPDDSYALPADMLMQQSSHVPRNIASYPDMYAVPNAEEEDISYSLPADVLLSTSNKNNLKVNTSPTKFEHNGEVKELNVGSGSGHSSMERGASATTPPIRPNHLDLRSPLNRSNKPRFPDPEPPCDASTASTSPSQLTNIAMAIDPTYNRRNFRPSSSYDTTSSTVTTSTSSSSPGMLLPADGAAEPADDGPAPPYMPIQGQRRTSSLEKKKKRGKDGCKQQ